jgi:regulator of nucleoside diphosphate kinase
MKKPTIVITESDYVQLSRMLDADASSPRERAAMAALEAELKHAKIVAPDNVPPDVITMNSTAELLDLDTGERMEFTLVFPSDADVDEGKISILAPVGVGMLGYRVGDSFERRAPSGMRRLQVIDVTFQPEAALAPAA